ncbi:hypothetical protein [Nocardia xishanensis]
MDARKREKAQDATFGHSTLHAPSVNTPPPAVDRLSTEELQVMLAEAVRHLYRHEHELLAANVREETLMFRIAYPLRERIERPGSKVRVDLEYNRRHSSALESDSPDCGRREPRSHPKYDVHGDSHVTPDLVIHCRGNNETNLLVVEAKKTLPARLEVETMVSRLKGFRDKLHYTAAVLLILSEVPVWRWVVEDGECADNGFSYIPIGNENSVVAST